VAVVLAAKAGSEPHRSPAPGQVALTDLLAQHDVGGLDVAVNDALRVRFDQALQHLNADTRHAVEAQRTLFAHLAVEGMPLEVFHDEIERAVGRLTEVVESHRVGMRQALGHLGSRFSARWPADGVVSGPDELDGDFAVQAQLPPQADHSHAAFAKDAQHLVSARQHLGEIVELGRSWAHPRLLVGCSKIAQDGREVSFGVSGEVESIL
jgi:hypothetical protein